MKRVFTLVLITISIAAFSQQIEKYSRAKIHLDAKEKSIKNLAIKLIQIATKTANEAMVRSRFLFWLKCGRMFSASKVGFKEIDIGMPLLRILFFII